MRLPALAFPIAAALLIAGAAGAAGLPMNRLATLAREADAILLGTCETSTATWDEQHRFIVTRSTVRSRRHFKGPAAETITVQTLGGTVGDVGMTASHAAALTRGERSILFLRRSQYGPYYVIWGGDDGKLPVRESSDGTMTVGTAEPMDLDGFAAWVEATEPSP
jgi:hypothetical protein